MKIPIKMAYVITLLIVGASLQNIMWYFRLKSPELMREFVLYFERDGAKFFLDFNVINYFFLIVMMIVTLIYLYYSSNLKTMEDKDD